MSAQREAFEHVMAKHHLDFTRRPGFPDCYRDDLTRTAFLAWLEAQAAMPVDPRVADLATGWISVADRLPPNWHEAIVWPNPSDYCMTACVDPEKGWTYSVLETGHGQAEYGCKVTHWMPLPDAPKDAP